MNAKTWMTKVTTATTATMIAASMAVTGMTYDAPPFPDVEHGVTTSDVEQWEHSLPVNVPTWDNTPHPHGPNYAPPSAHLPWTPSALLVTNHDGATVHTVKWTPHLTAQIKHAAHTPSTADDIYIVGVKK